MSKQPGIEVIELERAAKKPARAANRGRRVFVGTVDGALNRPGCDTYKRLKSERVNQFILYAANLPAQALAERVGRLRLPGPRMYILNSPEAWRSVVKRLSAAGRSDEAAGRIIDAWWEDDSLVVVSPLLERLTVPAAASVALAAIPQSERVSFEIDPDGLFLHWPGPDIHLGWAQFEQMVDPTARLRARQSSRVFNRAYGQQLRRLRLAKGLTQAQVAGLERRQVIRIEQGQSRATHASLSKFAAAFGLTIQELVKQLSASK